jgi:transcriptional regulator with XRE-family HTH domain
MPMNQGLTDQDPDLCKQKLAKTLREIRERKGLSREDVASPDAVSMSQLTRIEQGTTTVRLIYLRQILEIYGVDEDQRKELEKLAQASQKKAGPPWWKPYQEAGAEITPDFANVLKYENLATNILNFEPHLVPGLLQTPAYARAVAEVLLKPDQVDPTVKLRLHRQELFRERAGEREQATFILDENVLHRVVGGADVMQEQLRALLDALRRPGIHLGILPFAYGLYPRFFESYLVLWADDESDESDSLMSFLEAPHADHLYKQNARSKAKDSRPKEHRDDFRKLQEIAAGSDPEDIIRRALSGMTG